MKSFMILMLNMFKSFLSPSLPTRAEGLVYGNSTVFHFANRPETQGTGWQSQYCFAVWIRIKHDQTWLLQRGQCGCPQLPYPNGVRVKTQCQRTDHRLLGWSKKDVADGRSIPRVSEIFPLYISVYIYYIFYIPAYPSVSDPKSMPIRSRLRGFAKKDTWPWPSTTVFVAVAPSDPWSRKCGKCFRTGAVVDQGQVLGP